jgi:hypothetical protein
MTRWHGWRGRSHDLDRLDDQAIAIKLDKAAG